MDSGNQPPLRHASRRLWEIAREHLREEKSLKARRALEARIRQRVDTIIGRASAKILGDLDGALSLFERRLGMEGQTDAR